MKRNLESVFCFCSGKLYDHIKFSQEKSKFILSTKLAIKTQNNNKNSKIYHSEMLSSLSFPQKNMLKDSFNSEKLKNSISKYDFLKIKIKQMQIKSFFKYSIFYVIEIKYKKNIFDILKRNHQTLYFLFLNYQDFQDFMFLIRDNKAKFSKKIKFELNKIKNSKSQNNSSTKNSDLETHINILNESILLKSNVISHKKNPIQNKLIFTQGIINIQKI